MSHTFFMQQWGLLTGPARQRHPHGERRSRGICFSTSESFHAVFLLKLTPYPRGISHENHYPNLAHVNPLCDELAGRVLAIPVAP